jgi:hypothetical protein
MKSWMSIGALVVPALLVSATGHGQQGKASQAPVLVELFTSQGCSSCPPADRLLSTLRSDSKLGGRVIPLAFHVDYWNYIGWQDPFSSAQWTGRQQRYAKALGNGSRVYTPQLVVNGREDCVGSNAGDVRARVGAALAAAPAGRVALAATPGTEGVKVRVEAAVAAAGLERDLDVLVAVYENGLVTAVGRGENSSRTLRNDYVVRRLQKAFALPPAVGSRQAGEVTLPLDRTWKRANLGVVAFLQDPATLAVHGAAVQPLASPARR